MKDREKYETKIKQGFVQIQLTLFASPLEKLTMTLEKSILKHFNDKKLFATSNKFSRALGCGYWNQRSRQALLIRNSPDRQNDNIGSLSAVGI